MRNNCSYDNRVAQSQPWRASEHFMTGGLETIKEEKGHIHNTSGDRKSKNKVKATEKQKKCCRICLCEESEEKDDPIISPC